MPAAAQRIAGTVREADAGPIISGGFLSLLNQAGEVVQADFTAADGVFSFQAPGAGEYRIRVQRIGYADWTTEPYVLAPGEALGVTIEIPRQPVSLVGLRVEVTGSCLDDPRQGEALATVWEEVRKALETAVWAEDRGELTFTLTEYARTLDPNSLATLGSAIRTRHNVRLPPFRSLPAGRLTTEGYALVNSDSSVFRAPDATVLLSEEFREAHCFGLARDEVEGEARLGITFRPQRGRDVVEIEGTLWLDEESAALREVELRYRNVPVPRGTDRRQVAANLVFDRLPGGPFYVRDWWIRFPVAGEPRRLGRVGLSDRPAPVLLAYRQTGGRVTDILVGGRALGAEAGVVAGVLRDSVSGEPLAGADIVLRDWDDAANFLPRPPAAKARFSAVTDEGGVFRLEGLPDGVYAAVADHPLLRMAGVWMNERRVVVDDRRASLLELWVPAVEIATAAESGVPTVVDEECGGRTSLAVTVRDESGLVALPNAMVVLRWSDAVRRPLRDEADANGRLVLCVPPDSRQATVWAELGDASSEQSVVQLEPGGAHEVELRLLLGDTRTGRIVGEVRDARTRRPVATAAVSVAGRAQVVESNQAGYFVLTGLPVGEHELSVRHIGYVPLIHPVTVARGLTTEVAVDISAEAFEMEPIVATVIRPRNLEIRGFYERRHWGELSGGGTFYTAEDIERRRPLRITHMIADVPGMRLRCNGSGIRGCKVESSRSSAAGFGTEGCELNVHLDGIKMSSKELDELVLPAEIAGIEVYAGAAAVPAEFAGSDARCGAVVIWTK